MRNWFVVGVTMLSVGLVSAQVNIRPGLLNKIPAAMKAAIVRGDSVRLTGKRTVEFLQGGTPNRHEEVVYRDGEKVRIEFPAGSKFEGQIIVEDANSRQQYLPRPNEVRVTPPRREEMVDRLVRFVRQQGRLGFRIAQGTSDIVAGYRTDQVVISDASGNVIQRLFIEPKSGAILRRQLFDAVGSQAGYFEFTEVNLNPSPFDGSLFRIERKGAKTIRPRDLLIRLAKKAGWSPLWLQESTGYKLESTREADVAGQKVLLQSYSSPHGRLSLYQLRFPINAARLKSLAKDKFQVYSWKLGTNTFVMVASLDEALLSQLAQQTEPIR